MEIILFLTLLSMLNCVWFFLDVVKMYSDATSILEYKFYNIQNPLTLQHGIKDNGLRCSMFPTSLMKVVDALKKLYLFSGLVLGFQLQTKSRIKSVGQHYEFQDRSYKF